MRSLPKVATHRLPSGPRAARPGSEPAGKATGGGSGNSPFASMRMRLAASGATAHNRPSDPSVSAVMREPVTTTAQPAGPSPSSSALKLHTPHDPPLSGALQRTWPAALKPSAYPSPLFFEKPTLPL